MSDPISCRTVTCGDSHFALKFSASRFPVQHWGPPALADVGSTVRHGLEQPLNFPPVAEAVVPGDRITIVLDYHVPQADQILSEVWRVLASRGASPKDITLLRPATWRQIHESDPLASLPAPVRRGLLVKTHDATSERSLAYLASSTSGERIYLASDIVHSDFVLPIGHGGFDPLLGWQSATAALFPRCSNVETLGKAHGLGHDELSPEDDRPLRQLIDEVVWLLGVQLSMDVISSACGRAAQVFVGSHDSVSQASRAFATTHWKVSLPERFDHVVVSVGTTSANSWGDVGAAVNTARRLVKRDGEILVVSNLQERPQMGLDLLRGIEDMSAARQTLREISPPDLVAAVQWASAVEWSRVSLLSRLEDELVEALHAIPLNTAEEAQRWIDRVQDGAFVCGANFAYGEIG